MATPDQLETLVAAARDACKAVSDALITQPEAVTSTAGRNLVLYKFTSLHKFLANAGDGAKRPYNVAPGQARAALMNVFDGPDIVVCNFRISKW